MEKAEVILTSSLMVIAVVVIVVVIIGEVAIIMVVIILVAVIVVAIILMAVIMMAIVLAISLRVVVTTSSHCVLDGTPSLKTAACVRRGSGGNVEKVKVTVTSCMVVIMMPSVTEVIIMVVIVVVAIIVVAIIVTVVVVAVIVMAVIIVAIILVISPRAVSAVATFVERRLDDVLIYLITGKSGSDFTQKVAPSFNLRGTWHGDSQSGGEVGGEEDSKKSGASSRSEHGGDYG